MTDYIGFMYIHTYLYIISSALSANNVHDPVQIVTLFLMFTVTIQSKEN